MTINDDLAGLFNMSEQSGTKSQEDKGLPHLLNSRVLLMCAGYFYEGRLTMVSESFVHLSDASIVYSTGSWDDENYRDIQKLHDSEWYVQRESIESFGRSKINDQPETTQVMLEIIELRNKAK
jgi:hypothetical protein